MANLGMAYYRNKQVDKALDALVTACTLDPKDAEIRGNLGTIRRQKGDLPGAIADLEIAVKLKPDDGAVPEQPRRRVPRREAR